MPPLTLIIEKEQDVCERLPLATRRGSIRLGRDDDNDLVLPDPSVSPHHALVTWRGHRVHIKTLCAINGIHRNGKRLRSGATLGPADAITIGAYTLRIAPPGQPAGSATTQPQPTEPAKKRLRLPLYAALALIVLSLSALTATHLRQPPAGQEEESTATTEEAAPATTPAPPAPDMARLIEQAEKALVDNNPVAAATHFRQAMLLAPDDQRLTAMFNAVQGTARQELARRIQADILAQRLDAAQRHIETLAQIAPDDPQLGELRQWTDAEQQFVEARRLCAEGAYQQAASLLEKLHVLHDDRRLALQSEIAPILRDQDTLARAESEVLAGQFPAAREHLENLRESPHLSAQDHQRILQNLHHLDHIRQFEEALEANDTYRIIKIGTTIAQEHTEAPPAILAFVEDRLDALRKRLAPEQAKLQRSAEAALERLSQTTSIEDEMTTRVEILRLLAVLNFLAPPVTGEQPALTEQKEALHSHLKGLYQQAYILEHIGQYKEARDLYQSIEALGWNDGHYYEGARQRLDDLERLRL